MNMKYKVNMTRVPPSYEQNAARMLICTKFTPLSQAVRGVWEIGIRYKHHRDDLKLLSSAIHDALKTKLPTNESYSS
jgi:hypothetical protein